MKNWLFCNGLWFCKLSLSSILHVAACIHVHVFSCHSWGQKVLTQQIQEIKKVPIQISLSFTFSLTTEKIPIQTRVSLKAWFIIVNFTSGDSEASQSLRIWPKSVTNSHASDMIFFVGKGPAIAEAMAEDKWPAQETLRRQET